MNTKLSVALALIAGVLGGLLDRYITPMVAFAQVQTPTTEIRAKSFTLVDASDRAIGTFTAEPFSAPAYPPPGAKNRPRMRIVLRDSSGCEIWSAGGANLLEPVCTR